MVLFTTKTYAKKFGKIDNSQSLLVDWLARYYWTLRRVLAEFYAGCYIVWRLQNKSVYIVVIRNTSLDN